jgi:hypothetical protein
MSGTIKSFASALRWRLKPVRWAGKWAGSIVHLARRNGAHPPIVGEQPALLHELREKGYAKRDEAMQIPPIALESMAGIAKGQAFVDVTARHPDLVGRVFADIVNDPVLSNVINGYFGGDARLWNVALNYSDPSDTLSDSQMWHFDYGDVRQLHFMVYFTDVDELTGPFTFLDAALSDKVDRHPLWIERLTDAELTQRYDIDAQAQAIRLCGKRGDVFLNDPGRLLHQGARCVKPRLVLFISFTTPTPMSKGGNRTISKEMRAKLVQARQAGRAASAIPDHVIA